MWTQKGQMEKMDKWGHNGTYLDTIGPKWKYRKKRNLEIIRILCKILVWNWENRKMWGQKASKWCGHWGPPLLALPPTLELPPHCSTSPYLVHFLEERMENFLVKLWSVRLICETTVKGRQQNKKTNRGKVSNGIFDSMIRSKSRERRQRKAKCNSWSLSHCHVNLIYIECIGRDTHSRGQNGSNFHLFSWNTMLEEQPSLMWWR